MCPEGKEQIWNDAVGTSGQPTMSHNLQPNSLGNREQLSQILQVFVKPEMQLEGVQSPPIVTILKS